MGEYAKNIKTGEEVKLGTCEVMHYCTLGQRKETDYHWNYNYRWYWRLPLVPAMKKGNYSWQWVFDYECKHAGDGNYEDWKYSSQTIINDEKFWKSVEKDCPDSIEENAGFFQLHHDCGMLLNVPCYHGYKLPENTGDIKVFWNGKTPYQMRLSHIVTEGKDVKVEISCNACGRSWSVSIDELEDLMTYEEMERVSDENGWHMEKVTKCYNEEMLKAIKDEVAEYLNDIK